MERYLFILALVYILAIAATYRQTAPARLEIRESYSLVAAIAMVIYYLT